MVKSAITTSIPIGVLNRIIDNWAMLVWNQGKLAEVEQDPWQRGNVGYDRHSKHNAIHMD